LPPAGGVIKSFVPLRGTSFVVAFSLGFQPARGGQAFNFQLIAHLKSAFQPAVAVSYGGQQSKMESSSILTPACGVEARSAEPQHLNPRPLFLPICPLKQHRSKQHKERRHSQQGEDLITQVRKAGTVDNDASHALGDVRQG